MSTIDNSFIEAANNLLASGREFHEAVEALLDWMNGNDLCADHSEQRTKDYWRLCGALKTHAAALTNAESKIRACV